MRVKCQRSKARSGLVGFSLIELLVVIAVVGSLAGLLLPALVRARDKGKTAACSSNLRQLILASQMYEEDYKVFPLGWNPPPFAAIWCRQLQPYVGRPVTQWGGGVFVCPSRQQGGFLGSLGYAQNREINLGRDDIGLRHVQDPVNTIMFADTDGWDACLYPDSDSTANVLYRHSGGTEWSTRSVRMSRRPVERVVFGRANAVFTDGHGELISRAPKRLFTLKRD